jgi:hypothetical protein
VEYQDLIKLELSYDVSSPVLFDVAWLPWIPYIIDLEL